MLTFQHLINKSIILSAIRLILVPCHFISRVMSFFMTSSVVINQAYEIIRNVYDIDSLVDNDRDAIMSRICYVQRSERQMREDI